MGCLGKVADTIWGKSFLSTETQDLRELTSPQSSHVPGHQTCQFLNLRKHQAGKRSSSG